MSRFVVFGEKNDYARNVWQTSERVMMKGLDLLTVMRCQRKPCLLPTDVRRYPVQHTHAAQTSLTLTYYYLVVV